MISSSLTTQKYIGQTTWPLEKRWKKHLQCARMIKEVRDGVANFDINGINYKCIRKSVLYNGMVDVGIDSFMIDALEECDTDALNAREAHYVALHNTQAPAGYNSTTGGGSKYKHSETSIQLMRQRKAENIDAIRSDIISDCPVYTRYLKPDGNGGEGVVLKDHPLCKHKAFYVKKYGSLDVAKAALKDFVIALETNGVAHARVKSEPDLAAWRGIKATRKGYKIEKYINKVKYQAGFESAKFTREENKARAIEWYTANIPQ